LRSSASCWREGAASQPAQRSKSDWPAWTAQDDDHDFGSTPIGTNLRAEFSLVEQPEQVRTIAAALDRIRSVGERRTPAPIKIGLQILDRRGHDVVYSSAVIAGAVLQADIHHKTSNVVSGRPYDVYETDTDRWVVLWARSLLPGSNPFCPKIESTWFKQLNGRLSARSVRRAHSTLEIAFHYEVPDMLLSAGPRAGPDSALEEAQENLRFWR
jgi:hypothetical protein